MMTAESLRGAALAGLCIFVFLFFFFVLRLQNNTGCAQLPDELAVAKQLIFLIAFCGMKAFMCM